MKKLFLMLILSLSALMLLSCAKGGSTKSNGIDLSSCVVIYPEDAPNSITDSADMLASFLSNKTGGEIKSRSDDYSGDLQKIFVGDCDSDFCEKIIDNLRYYDYTVYTDNKNMLLGAGSNESVIEAVEYFCNNYSALTNENIFTKENNFENRYEYIIKSLTIGSKSIDDFCIVYPENQGTYAEKFTAEKYAAQNLQKKLAEKCGANLELIATDEIPENAIVISAISGDTFSYSYKTKGTQLTLQAGGTFAYSKAFDALLQTDSDTLDITGEKSENNVITEAKKTDFVYYEKDRKDTDAPIGELTIGNCDISDYVIIYPTFVSQSPYLLSEKTAAEYFRQYIEFATGKTLEISNDKKEKSAHEILIGHTNREDSALEEEFGDEEYIIKTNENNLLITGGEKRGVIYGVFSFLEEYVGYSFISADTDIVYKNDKIEIPAGICESDEPSYEFRDICQKDAQDETYSMKRKLNSFYLRDMDYSKGGSVTFTGGLVHTMSKIFGISSENKQPCLCDEENYQTVLRRAKTLLQSDDTATILSVTQNDNNNYCSCADCQKVNNEEGSTGGTQMRFINRLATELKEEYPNVRVLTLAYMYSIKPTKTKPVDNVIVQYCVLESCCSHSLNDFSCSENQKYFKYAKTWSEMTDNLYIWYYTTDFDQKYNTYPFMNFGAIYDNFAFFKSLGVKGVFNEGLINDDSCEFALLRNYLISRLMWDSDMTREEYNGYINEFIDAFYGEGSEVVALYFNILSLNAQNKHFNEGSAGGALFDYSNLKVQTPELQECFNKLNSFQCNDKTKAHISLLLKGFKSLLKNIK